MERHKHKHAWAHRPGICDAVRICLNTNAIGQQAGRQVRRVTLTWRQSVDPGHIRRKRCKAEYSQAGRPRRREKTSDHHCVWLTCWVLKIPCD